MANFTENYQLKKPIQGEFYDVADQNGNMDIIDQELKNREIDYTEADKAIKALENPEFEDYMGSTEIPDAATAIANIKSKGKIGTIFSNVKAAFKGACLRGQIVNNCVTNRSDLPGSAAQLKVLMDMIAATNNNLGSLIKVKWITKSVSVTPDINITTDFTDNFYTEQSIPINKIIYCNVNWSNSTDDVPISINRYYNIVSNKLSYIVHKWATEQTVLFRVQVIYFGI